MEALDPIIEISPRHLARLRQRDLTAPQIDIVYDEASLNLPQAVPRPGLHHQRAHPQRRQARLPRARARADRDPGMGGGGPLRPGGPR